MDFLIGAAFLYSAYIHYPHFKKPERCGRPEIKRMALTLMLVGGGYGAYRVYEGLGFLA